MHGNKKFEEYVADIEMPQDIKKRWKDGLEKAKKEEGITLKKIIKGSGIAAALLGVSIMIGAVASPTFASNIEEIFFGKKIVDVSDDEGVQKGIEENFGEKFENKIFEDGDFKLEVTDVVFDSQNCFVLYEIEGPKDEMENNTFFLNVNEIRLEDGTAIRSEGGRGSEAFVKETIGERTIKSGYIQSGATQLANKAFEISMSVMSADENFQVTEMFKNVKVEIPPIEIQEKEVIIDKEVVIKGEVIEVERLMVSPMRSTLYLKWNSDMKFKITDIKNAVLRDNEGHEWMNIQSEYSIIEDVQYDRYGARICFESVYDEDLEKIYIDSIVLETLDKDKEIFEIDPINKTVQEPYNERIEIISSSEEGDDAVLEFRFKTTDYREIFEFDIMNPLNKVAVVSSEYERLNLKGSMNYDQENPIFTAKFNKKCLRGTMECRAGRGAGEVERFDLDLKIK